MIITRAPYRVSFLGGGTDYPEWFKHHGGATLSCAIDKYCWIMARRLPPFFDHRTRVVWSEIELVKKAAEIKHPSARACLELLHEENVELHCQGDLPARSGIGSSSSFTVALLHSLYTLKGQLASKEQLAREAIRVERDILDEAGGLQDQIAASYGGINLVEYGNFMGSRFKVNKLPIATSTIAKLAAHCTLFFIGQARDSNVFAETYRNHAKDGDLSDMFPLVAQAPNCLMVGDIKGFAAIVTKAWELKRRITKGISGAEAAYERAMTAGAMGGKLLGAGGGGFMLIIRSPEKARQVSDAMEGLLEVPFQIDVEGSKLMYFQEEAHKSAESGI